MKSESKRPITIEDLLRLKRAERPAPEFWEDFDRKLRAKQLAALVEKRPWWQSVPEALGGILRFRVVLGACAALAVTIFTVRQYDSGRPVADSPASEPVGAVASAAPVSAASMEFAVLPTEPEPEVGPLPVTDSQPEPVMVAAVEEPEATPAAETVVAVHAIPVGAQADVGPIDSPAARHIAANLAAVQSDVILSRRLLDVASSFEERVMPARVKVEPLQQMTPPGENRRSRILTAMVSTASLDASPRTTARAASRIDEERLYDQVHRFGARGDRVQLKF